MPNNEHSMLRVVIPARFSSSRLPGKPLVDLAGKPMIARVYERVFSAFPMSSVIVATDDNRIAKVLENYSIPFAMTKKCHESGSDRIAEVAKQNHWDLEDIILNVQGDEPLIPTDMLRSFADFSLRQKDMDMTSIGVPIDCIQKVFDPNIVKLVVDETGKAIYFSRAPIPFCRDIETPNWPVKSFLRHVGIYAYRNAALQKLTTTPVCPMESLEKLEQLRALWLNMKVLIMPWHIAPPHGIDTPEDINRVIDLITKES